MAILKKRMEDPLFQGLLRNMIKTAEILPVYFALNELLNAMAEHIQQHSTTNQDSEIFIGWDEEHNILIRNIPAGTSLNNVTHALRKAGLKAHSDYVVETPSFSANPTSERTLTIRNEAITKATEELAKKLLAITSDIQNGLFGHEGRTD
jgi:hypothetical protein